MTSWLRSHSTFKRGYLYCVLAAIFTVAIAIWFARRSPHDSRVQAKVITSAPPQAEPTPKPLDITNGGVADSDIVKRFADRLADFKRLKAEAAVATQRSRDDHPEVVAFHRYAFRLHESIPQDKGSGSLYGAFSGNGDLQKAYRNLLTARNIAAAARSTEEVGGTTIGEIVSKYIDETDYGKLVRRTCAKIEREYFPESQDADHSESASSLDELLMVLASVGIKHAGRFQTMLSEVSEDAHEAYEFALQESYAVALRGLVGGYEKSCAPDAAKLEADSSRIYSDLFKEYEKLPLNSPERLEIARLLSQR